eukprot:449592-Hanusia_phi.AAC.1
MCWSTSVCAGLVWSALVTPSLPPSLQQPSLPPCDGLVGRSEVGLMGFTIYLPWQEARVDQSDLHLFQKICFLFCFLLLVKRVMGDVMADVCLYGR